MKLALRVWPYVRREWRLAVTTVVLIALVAGASLLTPWPMKLLVDQVLGGQPVPAWWPHALGGEGGMTLLSWVVVAGVLVVLLQGLLSLLREFITTRLKLQITLAFRSELYEHAQHLSLAYHDRADSGELAYVMTDHAGAAAGLAMTVPVLLQHLLTFVGMFSVLLWLDASLALASLLVVPFLYATVNGYAKRINAPLHEVKALEGRTLSIIQETMAMLRVIVAFGREEYEGRRFRRHGERAARARVSVTLKQSIFGLTVNLITGLGIAVVIWIGGSHVLDGRLSIGELLVVLAYVSTVYQSLGSISSSLGSVQDQVVSLERAFRVLDTTSDIVEAPDATALEAVTGHVHFEGVSFVVGARATLADVDLSVAPGEFIGIVGPTGAGKTTLLSLICRFIDATTGRVLVDARDVTSVTLASLRQQIGIVTQEPVLFAGSIEDNIRYGRLEATEEEVRQAARAAKAHDFIEALPDGYGTRVGERGAGLSGGERQRIAVARTFLKNAPILMLDEPTASIDPATEAPLLEALEELRAGRTTFMISHRLASLRHADRILVLDGGRIVEQGSPDELARGDGLYGALKHASLAG